MDRSELFRAYERLADAQGVAAVEAAAIRSRAPFALDLLSCLATGGACVESDILMGLLEASEIEDARGASKELAYSPAWLAAYSRAIFCTPEPSGSGAAALNGLLEACERDQGSIAARHARIIASLLLERGHVEKLSGLLPHLPLSESDAEMYDVEAERLGAARGRQHSDINRWNRKFAHLLDPNGFEFHPISPDRYAFNQLRAKPLHKRSEDPMVSVIVPVFRPDRGVFTAVQSILDQTWSNLELLIIDDGSGESFARIFDEVQQLDPRVRLIRRRVNGGTYRARNTALKFAKGELIAGQDADDWSHPRRIEIQAEAILSDDHKIASVSQCMRTFPDLSLGHSGAGLSRLNTSSLIYRAHPVHTRLGYYDDVRMAADSEFLFRIETFFGRDSVARLDDRLAIVRLSEGSLSRGDFAPGWQHPRRVAYRNLYQRWHRSIRKGGSDPFLDSEQSERPFPAPPSVIGGAHTRRGYDVVILGDWRTPAGMWKTLLEDLRECSGLYPRVGFAHFESMSEARVSRDSPCDDVLRMFEAGEADWVLGSDDAEIDLLIVHDPSRLLFVTDESLAWSVAELWIVAHDPSQEHSPGQAPYTPNDVESVALDLLGVAPMWFPKGANVRRCIKEQVAAGQVSDADHRLLLSSRSRDNTP